MSDDILTTHGAPLLEIVVTARPSWARVSSLVENYAALAGNDKLNVTLVGPAVSKRYGNLENLKENGLTVDLIPTLGESDSLDAVALSAINGSSALINKWSKHRPECVLVVADRTETLGVSVAAAIMQIPLIHLQGGEISGSIDDKIRDANTKLADLHLTTNEFTKKRIISMGESSSRVFEIGCPSIDIVKKVENQNLPLPISSDFYGGVGNNFLLNQEFGIIMFHPDTLNQQDNSIWINLLVNLVKKSDMNWFWFWPNPDHGTHRIAHEIRNFREHNYIENVRFIVNLNPESFIQLASKSALLVGNSSFGIREASALGLPVVNLGKRQFGRQKNENVLDLPEVLEIDKFMVGVNTHMQRGKFNSSNLYGDGTAGFKGASIIAGWQPSIKHRVI